MATTTNDHVLLEAQKQADGRYLYRPALESEREDDSYRPFDEVAGNRNKRFARDPERQGGACITVSNSHEGAQKHFGENARVTMSASSREAQRLEDDPDWYRIGSVSVRQSQPDMPVFIPTPPFMR